MHITSKSLKPAAGALALTLFIMAPSMGGCGGHRVAKLVGAAPSTMSVTTSAQFEVGNTPK
jgi:hypothetical protein